MTNLTVSETFPAAAATSHWDYLTSSGTAQAGAANNFRTTISYDAATGSYLITDPSTGFKQTFGPGDKDGAQSTPTYTVYTKPGTTGTDTLKLSNPGSGNPLIALTYTGYGLWRNATPRPGAVANRDTFFVYGIRTATADMPTTGTATYSAIIDGSFTDTSGVYTLSGTGTYLADFGNGTIGFSAAPTGTRTTDAASLALGTFNGTGKISGSSFNASAGSASPTSYSMGLLGYFFGPQAAEIGASFLINGGNNGRGIGAMVGTRP